MRVGEPGTLVGGVLVILFAADTSQGLMFFMGIVTGIYVPQIAQWAERKYFKNERNS